MAKIRRTVRDLRLAAMAGNHAAAGALLKLYGQDQLAAEIKRGKPFSNRVRIAVAVLTAGTNSHWEWQDEHGEFHNDLQHDPDPPRQPYARMVLDD